MDTPDNKGTNKNFYEIIQLVKRSNFFCEKENIILENTVLMEISIENIGLPFRLKCFSHKQGIISLEELLNTKSDKILRCRNIGIRTILESRKVIIDFLNKIEDCFNNLDIEENKSWDYDAKNIIVKYFPLLQGTFRTLKLNFNFIYKDISYVNVPKRIEDYIKKKKQLKIIYDLLNINYDELKREQNISRKTIGRLQYILINLLGLEKVIFLPEQKKYELITIP